MCELRLKKEEGQDSSGTGPGGPHSAIEQVIVGTVSPGPVKAVALLLQRLIKAIRSMS